MTSTHNSDSQSEMTPARALEVLTEGNARYCESKKLDRDLMQQVQATSGGQWPFAVVLGCIDSRAAPEHVFDQGIGDIFSVRLAGNIVNEDVLGSIEFSCKVAGARLVVVLGHSRCGAVMGACDDVQMGNLSELLSKLKPAVDGVSEPADASQRNSKDADFVQSVANKNVELGVAALRERSPILSELEAEGSIKIVGAMYDVKTGAVEFSS